MEERAEVLVAEAEVRVSLAVDADAVQPWRPPDAPSPHDASHVAKLRAMEAHERSAFFLALTKKANKMGWVSSSVHCFHAWTFGALFRSMPSISS